MLQTPWAPDSHAFRMVNGKLKYVHTLGFSVRCELVTKHRPTIPIEIRGFDPAHWELIIEAKVG